MKGYIVTEGRSAVPLLDRLLADEIRSGIALVSAGAKSSAQTLARSLVAARRRPVALVMDADTTDDGLISRQRLIAREFLDMASPGIPTEVFLAVPKTEILFFTDRPLLERIVGRDVSEREWIIGQFQPKKTLEALLAGASGAADMQGLVSRLTDAEVRQMREHCLIAEIRRFIREAMSAEATKV